MRQLDHAHLCPEQPLRGRPLGGGRRLLVSALWLSLLMGMSSPERPGGVKGAPLGAAKRTLDGEDRSEIIAEEGKPERWIPDDSETRGKPDGMCACQP